MPKGLSANTKNMTAILNHRGKISFGGKVNEDKSLLSVVDDIFREKRGFIVKMPKAKESVATCFSGGQDSIANIAILLEEFKLNVYPFFINHGQSNYKFERESCEWFNDFFKEKYPGLYHDYLEIGCNAPGLEYKDLLREAKRMVDSLPLRHNISYPARNPIIFLTGMEYGYALQARDVSINTIFAAHVSSDSSYHCSLTWGRIMNLLMCQITNDWNWQFISLPIEREFGNYYDKDVWIKWCIEQGVPIERARTCVKKSDLQCGDCPTCWDRRRAYKELGLRDPVPYLFEMGENYPTYYQHEEEKQINEGNRG